MQATEIITAEEAVKFVENELKISNFNSRRATNALQAVNDVVIGLHMVLPFQNISLLASKRNEYAIPTASDIREAGLSCRGGLCVTNNMFAWAVFSSLGFRASTIVGSVKNPGDHVIVLLSDVSKLGSRHLVDVGFGYPTYQAIDLNFPDGEDCEFVKVGLRFKYTRNGNNNYARSHWSDHFQMTLHDGWTQAYRFTTDERVYPRDYAESLLTPYRMFSKRLRIVTFKSDSVKALFYDGEKSEQMQVKELFSDRKTVKNIASIDEAIQEAEALLPNFSADELSDAFDNWMYYKQFSL